MRDALFRARQKSGFRRYDVGVPLNIRPVPRHDQYGNWGGEKEDGSDIFGKYLNSGCCVSNTTFLWCASQMVGRTARAERMLDAMPARPEQGVFFNLRGFPNGFGHRYPEGAECMDWDGHTGGYEAAPHL